MKPRMFIAALTLMTLPLFAHASCDAVKSDIDAKIKANGVSNYSLDVVAADQADKSGGKVVGQCEGNKAIVYSRGQSKAADDNSDSTPNKSPADADKSAPATTSPGNTPKPQHPVADRSGQTGG
ncbi:DUF1161 domain-containing protein [Dyella flava]|uniref:DUF1161 domain-containing protein n=1 Tax=Dyella flava TaxID=1920170 RepID=A0ABS2JZ85_9GAMM|nr:DUF1161 domain-containing protein [Dyella flava]MBM7124201.1 DUF1161 domain-containing protein [Dyella flava]GLQ50521.1 hypothetical protein GCM10010872_19700 [Dyella flava]